MFGKLKETYERSEKAVKETVTSIETSVTDTKDSITDGVNSTLCSIESSYDSVSNTIKDGVDTTTSTIKSGIDTVTKTVSHIISFAWYLGQFGILVASIIAPVPTFIGAAILLLLVESIDYGSKKSASHKKERKSKAKTKVGKRQVESALKLLKKYGKIPETAEFGNSFIKMTVNSATGTANGQILQGEHKGSELSELSLVTITSLRDHSSDKDTEQLLDIYLQYREKMEDANGQ